MVEGNCNFCENKPIHQIYCDGMRFGFCDHCKTYIIMEMAKRVNSSKMTTEGVYREETWIIPRPNVIGPPFPCNFPEDWKEIAINLANKMKEVKKQINNGNLSINEARQRNSYGEWKILENYTAVRHAN